MSISEQPRQFDEFSVKIPQLQFPNFFSRTNVVKKLRNAIKIESSFIQTCFLRMTFHFLKCSLKYSKLFTFANNRFRRFWRMQPSLVSVWNIAEPVQQITILAMAQELWWLFLMISMPAKWGNYRSQFYEFNPRQV